MGELARRAPDDEQLPAQRQAASDQQLIELWLHGRAANTQVGYRRAAEAFIAYAGGAVLRAITLAQAQAWALHLEGNGLASGSVHYMLSAVKSLFAFGAALRYLPFDTLRALRLPAVRDTLSERILDEDQVARLITSEPKPRNRVILHVLYVAGLRRSELANLQWRDCQGRGADGGQLTVFGKGGKTRSVLVPLDAWKDLLSLQVTGAGRDDFVFRSRRGGGALSDSQVWRIVKAAAKRAGLSDAISPHWLRHCHASHAMGRGCKPTVIQQTLGHSNLATTTRYLHARPNESSATFLPKLGSKPPSPPASPGTVGEGGAQKDGGAG